VILQDQTGKRARSGNQRAVDKNPMVKDMSLFFHIWREK
jgi:hypothetical protein